MRTLTIKVPDALFADIDSVARTRKVSKSEVVRERLTRDVPTTKADKTSLWSRMEDLVISSDSLPSDLSSKKSHMKGYGKKRAH
jgi:hypothetical protein